MACTKCQLPYPDELLSPIMTTQDGILESMHTEAVCGICALEISNEIANTHRTAFTGRMAEELRQKALQWRTEHGL